ncbi:MAG: acyltransferase, partial [Nitrobacter sp.]
MTVKAPEAGMLRSLQIGRGLAALFVVLYHLNNSVWGIAKYFPDPFSPLLSFGNAGVQFFFVLSGFIIYLVHADDTGRPRRLLSFAFKRFVRVFPTYWVVLFAVLAALLMNPALGTLGERTVSRVAASVLLVPYPQDPIVSVAWTLEHELLFYLIFSIAILNARIGKWVFVAWQAACLANTLVGSPDFPYGVIFSANNLLFSFGLAMAFLFRKWRCPAPGFVAIGGALAFLAVGLH